MTQRNRYGIVMSMETTNQAKSMNRNPQGKGGFAERPQDISPGGWKKENVFSYQFKRFMNMTRQELEQFTKDNDKGSMTMAEHLALKRILAADKSLPDFKEIADRTEGKAMQPMEIKAEVFTIDAALE